LRSPPTEKLGIEIKPGEEVDPNLLREKMTEVMSGKWVQPVEEEKPTLQLPKKLIEKKTSS
jgi:hypothetical protein